jgi:hypothetical protein
MKEVVGAQCPSCDKKLKKISINNGDFIRIITYLFKLLVGSSNKIFFMLENHVQKIKSRYNFRSLFEEWMDHDKRKKSYCG